MKIDLAKIRKDALAATQGEWRVDGSVIEDMKRVTVAYARHPHHIAHADSQHIANMSPANTLALLDLIERQRELVERMLVVISQTEL